MSTGAEPLSPWERFVLRHTKPGNFAVHALSALLFFGMPILALALWTPWPLLGFAISGWVGAAGHRLFDDGGVSLKEATAQPEVPYYVLIMFWRLATGGYAEELRRARARAALLERPPGGTA